MRRFFETTEAEYAPNDIFVGVRVPAVRMLAKKFAAVPLMAIEDMLESPIHEMRLLAAIIMSNQARQASAEQHKAIVDLYIRRTDRINNCDLVDSSCRDIVGEYVRKYAGYEQLLRELATSPNIWERRIAMVSTWSLIRVGSLELTYEIAELLLADNHDLIRKAVGWMLRSAGDKDQWLLRDFLTRHIHQMPRTTLRYAIGNFSPEERQYFLKFNPE